MPEIGVPLHVYDGMRDTVVTATRATDCPSVSEWLHLEPAGGVDLRTYGVTHRIDEDGSHEVTVHGWEPDATADNDDIARMVDVLWGHYRESPHVTDEVAGEQAGGRVYYFKSSENESFFAHQTPVVPAKNHGVTIEGTAYCVLDTDTGVDADGLYTMVTVTEDWIDGNDEEVPPPVTEARRNLEGQRRKAETEWS